MKALFLLFSVLTLSLTNQALACGGLDLDDETILSSPYIAEMKTKILENLNQEMTVEKIVRAGNDILDIDEQVVASAMCAANYTHIYLKSSDGSRCVMILEVLSDNTIEKPRGAECKRGDGTKQVVR